MKGDMVTAPASCGGARQVMDGEDESGTTDMMFGPLRFPDSITKNLRDYLGFFSICSVSCILCPTLFNLPEDKSFFLVHLLEEHKLIIADVDKIAGLKGYCDYWRRRLSLQHVTNFCSIITCKDEKGEKRDEFYLLSDAINEDKLIREGLQRKRLEWVLDIQARERSTPVQRTCIFCWEQFQGERAEYFHHLYLVHNFHLGFPDNLVFTDELLDLLEAMMKSNQCLFCEGRFYNRSILKEHMRKKQHKRVNPDNKLYDRFFVINYLEMGRTWQQIQNEEEDSDYSDNSDWSDWTEDNVEPNIVCLYCEDAQQSFEEILDHMCGKHQFDFQDGCEKNNLNFYEQVKLVNFIRLCVHNVQCPCCTAGFSEKEELLLHMSVRQHFKIPERRNWDQPEFFFPTYENDSFLCHLVDLPGNDKAGNVVNRVEEAGNVVYAPDAENIVSTPQTGNRSHAKESGKSRLL